MGKGPHLTKHLSKGKGEKKVYGKTSKNSYTRDISSAQNCKIC
jgi:hypothetical protein